MSPVSSRTPLQSTPFRVVESGTMRISAPEIPRSDSGSMRDVVDMCWRHRRVFLVSAIAVSALFYLNSLRTVPLYESRATLEANLSGNRIEFQEDKEYPGRIENGVVNTQTAKFLSTPVLARTLELSDLGSGPAYRASENQIGLLRSRLVVNTNRDSWAFDVSLRDEDGERAQRGLEAILTAYFQLQDERSTETVNDSVSFLARQVDDTRRSLDEAHKEEQVFRESHAINSADPDDNDYTKELTALNTSHAKLDSDMSEREAVLEQVRSADAVRDEDGRMQRLLQIQGIGDNPLVSQLQQELLKAQAEVKELTQKYGAKHPRMKEKQLEIEAKNAQFSDAVSQARAAIVAAYTEVKSQVDDLDRRIAREKAALTQYRADLVRLQSLIQESHNRTQLLDELSKRKAQEEVVAKMNARQVTVINPAEAAVGPINVNKARSLAMALFLGLVGGLLTALGFEKMDPRVRGTAMASELSGLQLLGRIPRLREGASAELGEVVAAFAAEEYKSLRSTIKLTAHGRDCRRIAIVSSSPGDGKSTVAHHLASAIAAGGERVLLIDADMRHPSQDALFNVQTESGLSMLLAGESGIKPVETGQPNLSYLGAGVKPPNPSDLLCSPALSEIFTRRSREFGYIIVDTPPVNYVSDALILAEQCDELILVVRDFGTMRGALVECVQRLEPLRPKLTGFIINAARERNEAGTYYIFKGES